VSIIVIIIKNVLGI